MNVFLLGYMGCGKTTIGNLLASSLKIQFIDFDYYIENETKKSIIKIFETDGEDNFRQLEHQYLNIVLRKKNGVIALGGGTPCFHNNMELINKNGISIYLTASVDLLYNRLVKEKKQRPLLQNIKDEDLQFYIEKNIMKREKFYHKAQLIINTDNKSAMELTQEISLQLKNRE